MRNYFCMLLFLAVGLDAARIEDIVHFPLDPSISYTVTTSLGEMTSLIFPGPITDAPGGSTHPENPQAKFMVQWNPGENIVKLKPRYAEAQTNLNIEYSGKVYVIKLQVGPKGANAVYFDKGPRASIETSVNSGATPASSDSSEPAGGAPALSVDQLLALLDRSKQFDTLKEFAPRFIKGTYRAFPKITSDYHDYAVTVEEAIRWDKADTLVLRLKLMNKTDAPIVYFSERTKVRLGRHLFPLSISDMSGTISAGRGHTTQAWIAFTGTANDQRNNLAPDQEWAILIERKVALAMAEPRPISVAPAQEEREPSYPQSMVVPAETSQAIGPVSVPEEGVPSP